MDLWASSIALLKSRVIYVSSLSSEAQGLPGFEFTGEMAEKHTGSFSFPSQILSDQQKGKTGVNIGSAFPRWSKLKDKDKSRPR